MPFWLRILAYVTGAIDRELLQKNEYLAAENRILRAQVKGRLNLSDEARRMLAQLGAQLGHRVLAEAASMVTPETIFRWYRQLVARKFDGSKKKRAPGRPPTASEIEAPVLRFARENPSWGYLGTRRVHIAGITHTPDEAFMKQVARQVTFADEGFLWGQKYLIHDRDAKFTEGFRAIIEGTGVECLKLPAHSPNLHTFAERWVRSAKEECLRRLILFGDATLRHAISESVAHYYRERNHQGQDDTVLLPQAEDRVGQALGRLRCRQRLGGLLKFYHRMVG